MQSEHIEEMDSTEVAKQTMIGDLVQASLDELKAAPNVWQKLSQAKQDEVIERLTHRVVHNVTQAIHIIASDDRPVIRAALEQITVKNGVKAVLQLSKKDPAFHDLADATGEEVLIVLPHVEEYANQETGLAGDPDQPGLPIDDRGFPVDTDTGEVVDPLLPEAIQHVTETRRCSISSVQRALKVGYNRAAILVDTMEGEGIVSAAGSNGTREVLAPAPKAAEESKGLPDGFSDVVEHVSWVGVFGKAMLEKYDGPQARAIEKALIDEGIVGATAYNGAHMVLIDKPDNVHETSLQAVERAVKNMKEVRVSDVANVSGLVGDANELLLQALEARGVVTRESDTGLRVVLSGGES